MSNDYDKRFLDRKNALGAEVASYSYIRWLLFHSFIYKKNGTPKYDSSSRKSYLKKWFVQTVFKGVVYLSFILGTQPLGNIYLIGNPSPNIRSLYVAKGVLREIKDTPWFDYIVLVNDGKEYSISDSRVRKYRDYINQYIEVYYGGRSPVFGTDFIWIAYDQGGNVITNYKDREELARSTVRSSYMLSKVGLFLLFIGCIVPLIINRK